MKRSLIRTAVAAGALSLLMALSPATSDAGIAMVTATGVAVCDTAGPVGRYTLNWTVTNNQGAEIDITAAAESGAFTGTVTFTPDPVPDNTSATGSDGPVPGDTVGTVTLTVDWVVVGGPSGQAVGTIDLAGNCVIPTTTTTTSTSTTTSTTSTTVRAITVTPTFTG
jgi:hypothetical protein